MAMMMKRAQARQAGVRLYIQELRLIIPDQSFFISAPKWDPKGDVHILPPPTLSLAPTLLDTRYRWAYYCAVVNLVTVLGCIPCAVK